MIRGLALSMLLLVGCAELAQSPEPETVDLPPEGYVFDDETPAAPVAEQPVDTGAEVEAAPEAEPSVEQEAARQGDEGDPEESAATEEAAAEPERPDPNAAARAQCERRKGSFTKSNAGAFFCVTRTRDGNKSCKRSRDCEGACLARSGTCAPLTPLVGCHEVRTNTGARATVCID